MALGRVKNIELISEKDAAVLTMEPLVLKEGEDPFVFVFKPHTDPSVNDEYLLLSFELQHVFSLPECEDNLTNIQKAISNMSPKEQIGILSRAKEVQFKIVDLLLIGYREKIGGELIEKNQELLDIIKENDVVVEFQTKLTKMQSSIIDKKKF